MPPTAEPSGTRRRIGAYVLAADPTWITSTVARYYDLLDDLVVVAASDGTGWTGAPIASLPCVALVRALDTRGIVRVVWGEWRDPAHPLHAETAQRQAALDTLGHVDWVIQLDGDELLPEPTALVDAMAEAERLAVDAIEWPMRVLFRRRRDGSYLEVENADGRAHFEYPAPVVVRPHVTLTEARRTAGPFLRMAVHDDHTSLQVAAPAAPGEVRRHALQAEQAVIHNSWARDPLSVRRKLASWGHHGGRRTRLYFALCWLPSAVTWRLLRDFHPLVRPLWPRLAPSGTEIETLLDATDRHA